MANMEADQRSWWRRVMGRSILQALIGDFFADKTSGRAGASASCRTAERTGSSGSESDWIKEEGL